MRISDWSSDVCSSDLFQRTPFLAAPADPDPLTIPCLFFALSYTAALCDGAIRALNRLIHAHRLRRRPNHRARHCTPSRNGKSESDSGLQFQKGGIPNQFQECDERSEKHTHKIQTIKHISYDVLYT